MPSTTTHLEARLLHIIAPATILFLDRFLHRLLPISLLGILIGIIRPAYSMHAFPVLICLCGMWALADLARGIELDHEHKQTTLRDTVLTWYHSRNTNT